jgi:peptide chain release factor 2
LRTCEGIFDVEGRRKIIADSEQKMTAPDFWDDQERAREVIARLTDARSRIEGWDAASRRLEDAQVLLELGSEEKDEESLREVDATSIDLEREVAALELQSLLSGSNDRLGAIVELNAGAGGTESQDWTEMLLRMYQRWCERRGYRSLLLHATEGEEAGLKSATLEVEGDFAYGYLKAEAGVHRLVRLSPFDANHRRHTSFASVFVSPRVDESIEIEVREEDLRVDTYRASGAGGQHVNKTSSAVRITHLPTGIVAQCQNERSQHRNRDKAMEILRSRLYQREYEKKLEERREMEDSKLEIAFGSQIRSYVFHPYNQVKDHRTNLAVGNVQAVMDGDLDDFIDAYLRRLGEGGGRAADGRTAGDSRSRDGGAGRGAGQDGAPGGGASPAGSTRRGASA